MDFFKHTFTRLAVLIDPDKTSHPALEYVMKEALHVGVDFFFVGSSVLQGNSFAQTIEFLKTQHRIPVVIFPGNQYQLHPAADALLFLSLISGRNPEYLIGQQVAAAPRIAHMGLSTIPVGYMLIDGGRVSTTAYITQTQPIPHDRTDIAVATAQAATMLGMRAIYLEAGSGAERPVAADMVSAVKKHVNVPVIVGGGIRTAAQAAAAARAGADTLVIGNVLETAPQLLAEIIVALQV